MTIRPSSSDASAPAVSTSGLTRRFGSLVAVDHLDLELPAGEVIGLVGPNGSGKSTLIRMLLGLVRPTSGTAHVLGEPISDPLRYAHRVGALIENPAFVPALSARANLLSLARLRGLHTTRVDEVLEVVGLAGRDRESVRRFSLGMKQRLGIAAALLPDPDLLVLDEPTNGLDPAGIVEIRGLLTDLGAQGRTVVVSSHLLSEIQAACDHLVVIRYGELLFNGPTAELMARSHEHVDVAPEDPGAAEPLAALLHGHGWAGEPTGDVLRLRVHARDSAAVNRAAADAGITLRLLQPARETLEDVFLRMTGPDASPGAASEGRGTR
jgi:ABC-2 type transport system ATP-binding protein